MSSVTSFILLVLVLSTGGEADLLGDCVPSENLSVCLKTKLVGTLDRLSRSQRLDILPGLSVLRDEAVPLPPQPRSETSILDGILEQKNKEQTLDGMIADRVSSIFDGRYLRIDLSQSTEEGRGGKRRRGTNAFLMMLMTTASMMLPLKMGTLAMLAGKALIISKLALALAAIVGLKKLLSGDDHQDYQVVQVPAGHGHKKRSIDMAYRAYRPQ